MSWSDLHIYSRKEWNARKPRRRYKMTKPTPDIWVHHTADPVEDMAIGTEIAYMQGIQDYHMDRKGWYDIAYSFVVMPSGRVYEGRGFGIAGGHTAGHNSSSHGICFAGNFQHQEPTDAAIRAGAQLIRLGMAAGFIADPVRNLGGHRDVNATACPGNNLYARLGELLQPPTPEEGTTMSLIQSQAPIVGIAVTSTGNGYYLVAADGAVFAFGDAQYIDRVEYKLPSGGSWVPVAS